MICSHCRHNFVNLVRLGIFAHGVLVLVLGVVLLFVDRFVSVQRAESSSVGGLQWTSLNADRQFVFDPPDWLAYALLSLGSVIVLYIVALPRKKAEHHD